MFLLTSYHEAAPMVFDEAMSLGVPVFTTATTSTDEMVLSIGGGFVCANEQTAINELLHSVLTQQHRIDSVKNELQKHLFTNTDIVKKINHVIS